MSNKTGLGFPLFYLAFQVARGFAGLIIPLYFVSVGVPVLGVGVAIGVFGASLLIFEILWGFLIDRGISGWLVFAAVAMTVATYLLIPLVKTSTGAIATEFVLGVSAPIVTLVARSNVISQRRSSGWAGGFGLLGAFYSVAQLIGSLIGSVSAPSVGLVDSFYVTAVMATASYLFYLRISRSRVKRGAGGPEPAPPRVVDAPAPRIPRPRLDWRGLPLLGLVAVPNYITFSFFANIIQIVVVKAPAISGTTFEAGIVVSAFWLSTAIFQPLLSWRGASRARLWIGVAMVASFGVYALMTQLNTAWELAIASFLAGACYSAISPLSLSILMVGIPESYTGRAMGFYGAAEDIGVIMGPLVGSAVWVGFGLGPAYLTLGASFLLVLIPYAIGMRSRPRASPRDKSPRPVPVPQ